MITQIDRPRPGINKPASRQALALEPAAKPASRGDAFVPSTGTRAQAREYGHARRETIAGGVAGVVFGLAGLGACSLAAFAVDGLLFGAGPAAVLTVPLLVAGFAACAWVTWTGAKAILKNE